MALETTRPASMVRGKKPPSRLKRMWRRVRKPIAESRFARAALASSLAWLLWLVKATNRPAPGSDSIEKQRAREPVAIYALWHGQHIILPAYVPRDVKMVALVSRSADAELNAAVAEKFGIETVRGSGGRNREKSSEKGGARALLALKKALADGKHVTMIADIPNGTPREAGAGIVTLARISGRPIVCAAFATSRRKVLEKTWDRMTVNLPFGKVGIAFSDPIRVPSDVSEADLERYRALVTDQLNKVTARAYDLADAAA